MDYVTADLHFGHQGILGFERSQFKSIKEHDEYIIRRLNEKLRPGDVLYVLGDVGFRGSKQTLAELGRKLRRIECRKKILVFGNHDRFSKQEALGLGFDEVHLGPIYYESSRVPGGIILSHQPVREALDNPYAINVHGHLHGGALDLPNYYNANIAQCGYQPLPLNRFEELAEKSLKGRKERFGQEWYAGHEVKNRKPAGKEQE